MGGPHFSAKTKLTLESVGFFNEKMPNGTRGRAKSQRAAWHFRRFQTGREIWLSRSYVNLRAWRDPMPRILDSVGVSKNRRSKSYVNLHVFAIRCPISAGVWAVPKDDQASRSRGAQPSFRKCRILPSPFSPERAVPGPERPKWPNPR